MEIREYLRILRRRAWVPLLLMVVTAGSTAVFVFLGKPEYIAAATVLAKTPNAASLNFLDIATSNNLALKVRSQLNLSEPVDQLAAQLSVSAGRTSDLYKISVTDPDPDRAVLLANTFAQRAAQLYQELAAGTSGANVTPIDADQATIRQQYFDAAKAQLDFNKKHRAGVNDKNTTIAAQALQLQLDVTAAAQNYLTYVSDVTGAKINAATNATNYNASVVDAAAARPDITSRYLKILYAAALALVMGIGIVFALEYFDNSIREPEEAEQLIGAPVVGVIPRGTARTLRPGRAA
jgi:capsular polysaccharide biosynthesis protein